MNIRLYNARILTMEKNQPVFEGQVWIKDGIIWYIGEQAPEDDFYTDSRDRMILWDKEIDCEKNLLMPGFKNAHTHSAMTLLRSYADDMPLEDWLNKQIFPVEAKLTGQDIYELTKLAVLEYLSGGVTGIFDMYLSPNDSAKACSEMGMRCVHVSGLNNFSQSLEKVEEYYLAINDNPKTLQTYQMGIHAEYTCSLELMKGMSELTHKYKAPFYAHMCETVKEVDECKKRYGMTPIELFDSLGLFDYGGGGYHCVHLEEKDYEILKKRGLYVITNPGSNTKLASGIAPVSRLLKENIPVAIGTDGPASNNCLDMFREMFLVTGLGKLREKNASAVGALDVLKMATVNGAGAMKLEACDVLKAGKNADIVMINLNMPNMQPINNIEKNLVYSGSKQNIKMTMIQGEIKFYDGRYYINDKPEMIYQKANEIIRRISNEEN